MPQTELEDLIKEWEKTQLTIGLQSGDEQKFWLPELLCDALVEKLKEKIMPILEHHGFSQRHFLRYIDQAYAELKGGEGK